MITKQTVVTVAVLVNMDSKNFVVIHDTQNRMYHRSLHKTDVMYVHKLCM